MPETILVADDGSENASKAVSLASDLAAKFGSKVVILHAIQPDHLPETLIGLAEAEHMVPPAAEPGTDLSHPFGSLTAAKSGGDMGERRTIAAEALGREVLNRAETSLRAKGVKDVSTILAIGDPAQELLAECQATKADMIVMGTRGLGGLKGLMVGSVSHKMINLAPCTCVLVK